MKFIPLIFIIWNLFSINDEKKRHLEHNGSQVLTTYLIDNKFIGEYKGSKLGFLQLDRDGNGIYRYDYSGLSPDCPGEIIEFRWGFILDESGNVVKLKRSYGYSYPILYNCSGENAFQGCTKRSMVDFLLVYDDGTITVSSSDDWVKGGK